MVLTCSEEIGARSDVVKVLSAVISPVRCDSLQAYMQPVLSAANSVPFWSKRSADTGAPLPRR